METHDQELKAAEAFEFPPVPDDNVWCAVRQKLVGASICATDACVAPEMRPVCWLGVAEGFAVRMQEDD